jgi:hypothetical protein
MDRQRTTGLPFSFCPFMVLGVDLHVKGAQLHLVLTTAFTEFSPETPVSILNDRNKTKEISMNSGDK